MRIGIDATCWWSLRGFGRFTRELIKAMIKQTDDSTLVLFVDRGIENEMLHPRVEVVQVNQSQLTTEVAVASNSRSIRDLWSFRRAVSMQSLDVFYFPAVYSWYPVPFGLPVVVTLHDAIAERFPEMIFPHWKGRLLWSIKMKLALWQANKIMTVSQSAKAEIIQYIGVLPDKIDVITEAADPVFKVINDLECRAQIRSKYSIPTHAKYIVYVGGFAPHKNLSGLVKGVSKAIELGGIDNTHLVFVGDPGGDGFHSNYEELLSVISKKDNLKDKVHFTGYVSDSDLAVLYSDALALAMPSFSEGFGLPAIEAMACHVPVLASKAGSIPEIVADAGLYFNPHSTEEIANAVYRIASDEELLLQLRRKAKIREQMFSWASAATLAFTCIKNSKSLT
tara:strand:+ start:14040 stop:15221 length:1182 start_codon:yes stop_codon:yes gene_type:complete